MSSSLVVSKKRFLVKVSPFVYKKSTFFKGIKLIYTPSNCESEICLVVDKDEKQEFLKMYDFKDTKERKNIWFNQTLKNYSHWADNDFEYYSIFS